jgi:hypothetical protein
MADTLPVHVLITRPSVASQRQFAEEAQAFVPQSQRVRAEVSSKGLIIHGVWEPDLETAYSALLDRYADLKVGAPETKFILEPVLLEPHLKLAISVPEDCIGTVLGEVSTKRRGLITSMASEDVRCNVTFEAPVSELWGYWTEFRFLTRGEGRVEDSSFAGYRPAPHGGGDGPVAAAAG